MDSEDALTWAVAFAVVCAALLLLFIGMGPHGLGWF